MNFAATLQPSAELTLLGWLFTALLLFLLVASILAARGVIPPNHIIDIRLPAVMRDSDTWQAGHRAAVLPAAIAFIVAIIFAALGLIAPVAYVVAIAGFVAGFIWVAVRASQVAARVRQ